jgi:hypothetical protein
MRKVNVISLNSERVKRLAIANGCRPVWSEHYYAWCCTCEDGTHCGDQQSSILSEKSASRKAR